MERVLILESTSGLSYSDLTNKYSSNRHLSTLFPLKANKVGVRSRPKHPDMSSPSNYFYVSNIYYRDLAVRRLRNLNPKFFNYVDD